MYPFCHGVRMDQRNTSDQLEEMAALRSVGVLPPEAMHSYEHAFADDPDFRGLASELNDLAAGAALAGLASLKAPPTELKSRLLEEIGPETGPSHPLEALAMDATEAVVLTNLKGRIEWVSPAFTQMCGYSLQELRGRKPGALLQGEGTDADAVARIREAVRTRTPITLMLRNYAKGGDAYWVNLGISPVNGPDGSPRGFVAIEKELSSDEIERLGLPGPLHLQKGETGWLVAE
jgi:PAS domain S-box-containing protein